MKKIIAAVISAALMFSPAANVVFHDQAHTVEAKGYKSGKRSFNTNQNTQTNNTSFFQNKKQNSVSNSKPATTQKGGFAKGGFMKGLMVGGLAGLLFGSIFANMGMMGSLLGLMINVLAIYFVISLIRTFYVNYRNKKRREEQAQWRN
ncbi:hypothetical protein [Peribacillus deserti]|uniref:Preprotein translocase subunit Tim44 n=1 Tax=Peribacillus deserti TaxID=673318 RepID=A0A2N5M5Y1_9BACI|nr:hypothetical protein [Peribacillus deserti]PLT29757.1 preprotein translocase subunit Tim44 [Peribacillus deserti]